MAAVLQLKILRDLPRFEFKLATKTPGRNPQWLLVVLRAKNSKKKHLRLQTRSIIQGGLIFAKIFPTCDLDFSRLKMRYFCRTKQSRTAPRSRPRQRGHPDFHTSVEPNT